MSRGAAEHGGGAAGAVAAAAYQEGRRLMDDLAFDLWDGYRAAPAPLPPYVPGESPFVDAWRAAQRARRERWAATPSRRAEAGHTPARRYDTCPHCGARKRKD